MNAWNRLSITTTVYECQGPRQTGWKTGSSILTTSNAEAARPLALLRPAETLERNWLYSNKRQEMVMSTNVLLNTIYRWKIKLIAILWHVTYSTDYYHRLTWESWFANLEQHHWSPQLTVTGTVQKWKRWSNWKLKAIESLLIYPSVKLWQKTAGSKRINHI